MTNEDLRRKNPTNLFVLLLLTFLQGCVLGTLSVITDLFGFIHLKLHQVIYHTFITQIRNLFRKLNFSK